MFIRTETNHLINVRYLRDIAIWEANSIRQRRCGEGLITHHNAPTSGHCVIGWTKNQPIWLTAGHPEHVAEIVLENLFCSLKENASTFDVMQMLDELAT
jgi:hypothetical protein